MRQKNYPSKSRAQEESRFNFDLGSLAKASLNIFIDREPKSFKYSPTSMVHFVCFNEFFNRYLASETRQAILLNASLSDINVTRRLLLLFF